MPFYSYQLSTEKDVEERLRKRFRAELEVFQKLEWKSRLHRANCLRRTCRLRITWR